MTFMYSMGSVFRDPSFAPLLESLDQHFGAKKPVTRVTQQTCDPPGRAWQEGASSPSPSGYLPSDPRGVSDHTEKEDAMEETMLEQQPEEMMKELMK